MTYEKDYGEQIISVIRSGLSDVDIKNQLLEYHENDIASIFEELTIEEKEKIRVILGNEFMSEVVSFLEDAGDYLSEIDVDDAAEIIEQMDADEALYMSFKKQLFTMLKEIRIALVNGVVLGIISFIMVSVYLYVFSSQDLRFIFSASGCVGLAMLFAMGISGLTGSAIPICLYRFKIDPAVASGPLITTINDLVAVISYYGLAWLLLLNM